MTDENFEVEEVQEDQIEVFDSLEDFEQQYLRSPKVGEHVEFTIRGVKKIPADECVFTFEDKKTGKTKKASNALSNVDYGVQVHCLENKAIFWVNSWAVWGQLKAVGKKLGNSSLQGIKVQVHHLLNGMLEENRDKDCWVVKVLVDSKWKRLNRETNEWAE